ncbi:MAG: dihydropteroate synthase [Thermoleophilia bacterium]|nr:dihydropteroate synthase [Thermoleophilia bacterium]
MFVTIGERINTSRPAVREAVEKRDLAYIQDDVRRQQAAGATYVDVNAGARIGHEAEDMEWLIEVIQPVIEIPLCLDSPDPAVLEMAYGMVTQPPMINSISLEGERYETMLPFLQGKDVSVIALCMDDTGLPIGTDDVLARAKKLASGLEEAGIARERIYVDPLIQPISTDQTKGLMTLEAVRRVAQDLPGIHFTCGLSNISYGLPQRKIVNRAFLTLLMGVGLDGAILDPLDNAIMAVVKTTEMLLGQDEYCVGYLDGVRAGQIVA